MNVNNIVTTKDCVIVGKQILELAKQVKTREDHIKVWDLKVELLHKVNDAFETGYFTREAYEELWEAKHLIKEIEDIAGKRAIETYAKNF